MALTDNFATGILAYINDLVSADRVNISQAIFEQVHQVPDIMNSHTLVTGVRTGSQVPIISGKPDYGSFPFSPLDCSSQQCGVDTQYSLKQWQLGLLKCRYSICLEAFDENFLIFWNQFKATNPDMAEADMNTGYMAYIVGRIRQNLLAAQWRAAYFGDTTLTSNALLNGFNGFRIQTELQNGIKIDIAKNVETTFAGQKMTGQEVLDTLTAMDAAAQDTEWYTGTEPIRMTKFMAIQYRDLLNSWGEKAQYCCDPSIKDPNALTSAKFFNLDRLSFYQHPIYVFDDLDKIINTLAPLNGGGGTAARQEPNWALMTANTNILLGTSTTNSLNYFDIFYDRVSQNIIVDANTYIGANLVMNNYVVAR